MSRSWFLLGVALLGLFLQLTVSSAKKEEETCDAIQAMAEAMEGSLSGSTCTANSDCDAVTCQDITGKLKVEIDMCEDPPEVTLSGKDLSGSSYSYTFDHSTSVTSPTGTFTVILDWDSESKILGLELTLIYFGTTYKIVPYSEIPIDDSDCSEINWVLILAIGVPALCVMVAVICCGVALGAWCCVLQGRRRRLIATTRFQPLNDDLEDGTL